MHLTLFSPLNEDKIVIESILNSRRVDNKKRCTLDQSTATLHARYSLANARAVTVNIRRLYSQSDLCDLVDRLLEVGLQLPGRLLSLRHSVSETLLDSVRLFTKILAGVGESASDDSSQSDAGLSLLLCQPENIFLKTTAYHQVGE